MKVIILDRCTVTNEDISFESLERLGDVTFFDVVPRKELAEKIGDADAVICNKAIIDRDVMEKCPNLKYIGLFATGYNNIDLECASERGICVANAPGYSTEAVAQHTFALILALAGSLCDYTDSTKNGGWIKSKNFSYFPFPIAELQSKTLGIFGYGSIGREVAKIGRAFNMNILVSTRTPAKCTDTECVPFDELLKRADYITLHAPLTKQTERMINRETLAMMKKSAYLINTSRGGAIDEDALAEALNEGKIAGAGLDVLTLEPMSESNPLRLAKNCLITPHVAWAPKETRARLVELVAKNLEAFMAGKPINKVN